MAVQSGHDHPRDEHEGDRHRWLFADFAQVAGSVRDESLALPATIGFNDDIVSNISSGAGASASDATVPGQERGGEYHGYESSRSGSVLNDIAGVALAAQGHPLLGLMAMHEEDEALKEEMGELAAVGLASQGYPVLGYLAAEADQGRGRDEHENSEYDGDHPYVGEEQHRWLSDEVGGQGQGQPVARATPQMLADSPSPVSPGVSALTSMGMAIINEQQRH
jgi:hypothetical protein